MKARDRKDRKMHKTELRDRKDLKQDRTEVRDRKDLKKDRTEVRKERCEEGRNKVRLEVGDRTWAI